MLKVLLWLDRFDLDGKQITNRRLCSLFEDKRMSLRNVDQAVYKDDPCGYPDPMNKTYTLSILLAAGEKDGAHDVELQIETDADVRKAASYLSSCFVHDFSVYGHLRAHPKKAIVAEPALIDELSFRNCSFANGEEDSLGETLGGSTCRCLVLVDSSIPAWQIDDKRLETLRICGCNELHVWPCDMQPYDDDEQYIFTEEGITLLRRHYCFTLTDNLPVPQKRYLKITWVNITPAFFKKVLERARYEDYDQYAETYELNVRYNIADHGNGIHFKSEDGEEWKVIMRHGKKDRDEFFALKPAGEDRWSPSIEFLEHEPELEAPDEWYGLDE